LELEQDLNLGYKIIGSKEEVWNETAYKTKKGFTKNDLILNKFGHIISNKTK
jgi:hypothetical protein